jgi:hypothetical protein
METPKSHKKWIFLYKNERLGGYFNKNERFFHGKLLEVSSNTCSAKFGVPADFMVPE